MVEVNSLKEIAIILGKFPGISEVELADEFITFKCCEETSLASIATCLDQGNVDDNFSIGEWRIEAHVDSADWITTWYWLIGPEEKYSIEAPILANKLKKELTEKIPQISNLLYPPAGLGTPDLSFVTVEQMVKELDKRDIPFVLGWEEDSCMKYRASGKNQLEMLDFIKFIYRSIKNKDKRN